MLLLEFWGLNVPVGHYDVQRPNSAESNKPKSQVVQLLAVPLQVLQVGLHFKHSFSYSKYPAGQLGKQTPSSLTRPAAH